MQRITEPLLLLDHQQRLLGRLAIDQEDDDLLSGSFTPEAAFADFAPLFHAFENAVDLQALSVVDDLDRSISALGLHLRRPDHSEMILIHDVQIWSNGGMTCRLTPAVTPSANGASTQHFAPQPVIE